MTRQQIESLVAWIMLAVATAIGALFPTSQACIFILGCVMLVVWFWLRPIRVVSDFIASRKRKNEKKAKNV
ncbi:unnamed protein product [marine sediment metagenome]|uniref:Uncharacterized protein n=1 Tax=marine sediment metagenome TaxID=412755 RepID=X0V0T9_9ZZZZ